MHSAVPGAETLIGDVLAHAICLDEALAKKTMMDGHA